MAPLYVAIPTVQRELYSRSLTYASPERSFSNTPFVLAGRVAVRLVLLPKEDMPRPLFELRIFEGGLNLAEENLMFPRLLEKEGLKERGVAALPKERGGVPPY